MNVGIFPLCLQKQQQLTNKKKKKGNLKCTTPPDFVFITCT